VKKKARMAATPGGAGAELPVPKGGYHFAYVFERFPTFTQTFCVREVMELERQRVRPMLFSIRDTGDEPLEDHFPKSLVERVRVLPESKKLRAQVEEWKEANALPQEAIVTLRHWGGGADKSRIYEAIYIGMKMREAGVRHAHAHFAGVGARTCWWLKRFFGITFSFTGHANDLFEPSGFEIDLDALMREAAVVVTVSDFTAKYLRGRFPKADWKIRRVYNGLDLTPFAEAGKTKPSSGPMEILSVGRLIEKKGFDDLIDACARLREMVPPVPAFRCVIVGDGPMEDALRARVVRLGLAEVVELAGAKSQPDIIALLGKAGVFALACVTEKSGGKDNLPTVLMEAMAASRPCVSTWLAGVPEMVLDGETGLLVEERDPEAFAEALARLLRDKEARKRMGEAGLKHAAANFAKEVTARSLIRCLVAFGSVRFDFDLAWSDMALVPAHLKQVALRGLRKLRPRRASRYVAAEREAKRTSNSER
jgi:colanic acid/amylovoran biosynthesis glycosyltransferase